MDGIMEWVIDLVGGVDLLVAAVIAAVIASVILAMVRTPFRWIGKWWKTRGSRAKNAHYPAVQVTLILDEYIGECVRVVRDDGIEEERGNPVEIPLPDRPTFPDDVDWKSIDHKLMEDILTLPRQVVETEDGIRSPLSAGVSDPDYKELVDDLHILYSEIGLDVLKITKQLRNKYKILERDRNRKTDSRREKLFEDTIKRIKRKRFLEDMEKEEEEYQNWNRGEEEAQTDKDHQ